MSTGRMPPRRRVWMRQRWTKRRGCWPNTRARLPRSCGSVTNWVKIFRACASRKPSGVPCCSASATNATRWTKTSAAPKPAAANSTSVSPRSGTTCRANRNCSPIPTAFWRDWQRKIPRCRPTRGPTPRCGPRPRWRCKRLRKHWRGRRKPPTKPTRACLN